MPDEKPEWSVHLQEEIVSRVVDQGGGRRCYLRASLVHFHRHLMDDVVELKPGVCGGPPDIEVTGVLKKRVVAWTGQGRRRGNSRAPRRFRRLPGKDDSPRRESFAVHQVLEDRLPHADRAQKFKLRHGERNVLPLRGGNDAVEVIHTQAGGQPLVG